MISRRNFMKTMCSSAVLAMASTLYPGLIFANARTDKRLVVVILRGGMDGIGAVVPYGDKNYQAMRGELALDSSTLLRVDPFFGLHPSLEPLAKMYQDGDMIAIPATATPYRERSHFDAQNVLELGSVRPNGLSSGFLNRLAGAINMQDDNLGLAFGQGMPLMMRGQSPVNSWAPSSLKDGSDDYISLVQKIYAHDALLDNSFQKALDLQAMSSDALGGDKESRKLTRKSRSGSAFVTMAELAGKWLVKENGPRIATLEMGGWDTHFQQGTEGGRMANNLSLLARGIESMKKAMGPTWSKTVIVAMTEFGRTVRPNGTRGTDHGTAGTMLLFGGALKGGRMVHQWPGLDSANLYQDRDLRPTIDMREVMKGVLHEHYGISNQALDQVIYPESGSARVMRGLIR